MMLPTPLDGHGDPITVYMFNDCFIKDDDSIKDNGQKMKKGRQE